MRQRERGAMLVIMAGSLLFLAMLGIGTLTVIRIVLAKQETQRVADSACLAAATIVKNAGLPFDAPKQAQAIAVAGQNHPGLPFAIAFTELPETPTLVSFKCDASLNVSAPAMIWAGGRTTVTASSSSAVPQVTLDNATRMVPKLMLVLDFSGSMNDNALLNDPQGRTTFQALTEEVNKLLAKNYNIELGLVIFADQIYDKVAVALNNTQKVSTDVNKHYPCPWYEDGHTCRTYSWDALHTAHQLYGPWDGGEERYVLFISDGVPFDGSDSLDTVIQWTENEANGLFTDAHANIITLQLKNAPDPDNTLQNFMQNISGSWDHHPDVCNYYNADSQASLDALLTGIGNMVACPLKLDHPLPANTAVHVFLRSGGAEEVLGDASQIPLCSGAPSCGQTVGSKYATVPGDLADENNCTYYQGDYFLYYAPKQSIFVTPDVCDKILNQQQTVIIRYARTQITQ